MNTQTIRIRKIITTLCFLLLLQQAYAQLQFHFAENKSPEWHEIIDMYRQLAEAYPEARLIEVGQSDVGKPIHLFIISKEKQFTPEEVKKNNKTILFINNGIHPGECNGMDASLKFAEDLLSKNTFTEYLDNTVVLIVPVFNIGGALNRSPYNRANQNGPEEHGFRGNAKNLDLNRDFVKMDSKNAKTLAKVIHAWEPHVFADTHSTNGADYPYTVTLISSHFQQLEEPQSSFMQDVMEPALYEAMNNSPYKMCPYVNSWGTGGPRKGIEGFYEYPRYLAGYTSTFHILSFTIETHMLKEYEERVLSSITLLNEMLRFTSLHSERIIKNKDLARKNTMKRKTHVLNWEIDRKKVDSLLFNGYTATMRYSELTGKQQLYYDTQDPWTAYIPYYNTYRATDSVLAPDYYIIPQAWDEVISRLKYSGIEMQRMHSDTSMNVSVSYITDYRTGDRPYNGHYWHSNTTTTTKVETIDFYEGDYIIPVKQAGAAFLVHTLEPTAYDSYFSWNFFDAVLSRKEYFSPYLFESTAEKILDMDPALRNAFNELKEKDSSFADNAYAQLRWIYERSVWSEPTYMRYPVYRLY